MNTLWILSVLLAMLISETYGQCNCPNRGVKLNSMKAGDMLLDKAAVLKINGMKASQGNKWPKNTLSYRFDGKFPEKSRKGVRELLKIYEGELGKCIKFIENSKKGHVLVRLGNGCSANVGYATGDRFANLHPGCVNKRNTKHEFNHLLGFMHEQSREDRDQYIAVTLDNVKTPFCGNFVKCKGCKTTTPYDYDSIMQYPSDAFSCNNKDTMVRKNGARIPFNTVVTELDKKNVRDYYGCN